MDQNDAASLSKWVADMNQNLSRDNSDPQMQLVWFPIKLDENGHGELMGEGDSSFNLNNLKSSESVFRSGSRGVPPTSQQSSLQLLTENKAGRVRVDGKLAESLEPPGKDENNNNEVRLNLGDPATKEESSTSLHRILEDDQAQIENLDENAVEVEIEPIDEVAVEVRPEDPANIHRRPVRHNWRMLLFILIIFILCYQLFDRYFINTSPERRSFSSFRNLFRLEGRGGGASS